MGAGEKAAPFESEHRVANVWEFQLLHGAHRPLGLGRYRRDVGIYLGGSSPVNIELLGAGSKAAPFENENCVANVWEFQLLHGAHRTLGFGRYRRVVGIYSGGPSPMGY